MEFFLLCSDFAQSTNSFTFSTEKKQHQRPNAADDQLELAMVAVRILYINYIGIFSIPFVFILDVDFYVGLRVRVKERKNERRCTHNI